MKVNQNGAVARAVAGGLPAQRCDSTHSSFLLLAGHAHLRLKRERTSVAPMNKGREY